MNKDFNTYQRELETLREEGHAFGIVVEKHKMDLHFYGVSPEELVNSVSVLNISPNRVLEVYDLNKELTNQIMNELTMEI